VFLHANADLFSFTATFRDGSPSPE
jgi:hypothetical protein